MAFKEAICEDWILEQSERRWLQTQNRKITFGEMEATYLCLIRR